ncbi:MAG: DUF3800 domain-containing protein [Alphaproteobacteria bacterium]|nr:DUF3800 domain-containing protein [Alphaproteobacteria bacterium]
MPKQLVFIDESGDAGFKTKSSQNFAFALIIFTNMDDACAVDKSISNIASLARHKTEFKYSKTCDKVKEIFFTEIAKQPFHAKVLYVNKMLVHSDELRQDANKFYNFFLKQILTHANLKEASIKIDGRKDAVKQELATYLRTQAKDCVKKVKYEDSKNNRLIQLADMIVGLTIHACSPNATNEQKKWLKLIKPKLNIWQFK